MCASLYKFSSFVTHIKTGVLNILSSHSFHAPWVTLSLTEIGFNIAPPVDINASIDTYASIETIYVYGLQMKDG